MRPRLAALVTASVFAASEVGHLRSQGQQPSPSFRAGVELIRLSVRVIDHSGKTVAGLTTADFDIRVDNVPQPITNVVEISSEPPATSLNWVASGVPDVSSNVSNDKQRLWAIVMDDCTLPTDPYSIRAGKSVAREIISHMTADDRAAIVFTWNGRGAQDFTGDHAKLLTAIETFSPGPPPPNRPCSPQFIIRQVWSFLDELQGARAALVYIGTPPGGGVAAAVPPIKSIGFVPFYGFNLSGLVASGLAVDPKGRVNFNTDDGGRGNAFLQTLATESGGNATINTNDPVRGVANVFEAQQVGYIVAFRPTFPITDGRFRSLRVRVQKPGLSIYPPDHIFRSEPITDATRNLPAWHSLRNALAGILPDSHSLMVVNACAFARRPIPKDQTATVSVLIGLQLPEGAGSESAKDGIDLDVTVFDADGSRQVAEQRRRLDVPRSAARQYDVVVPIALKPGRYPIRVAASGASLQLSGSVYADIVVPRFGTDDFSMSGLVIQSSSASPVVPRNALGDLLPIQPTTQRDFHRTDSVIAFARVYERVGSAVTPVLIRAELRDEAERTVWQAADRRDPTSFSLDASTDWQIQLPLAELIPGKYLLHVVAAVGGHEIARDSVISVRTGTN